MASWMEASVTKVARVSGNVLAVLGETPVLPEPGECSPPPCGVAGRRSPSCRHPALRSPGAAAAGPELRWLFRSICRLSDAGGPAIRCAFAAFTVERAEALCRDAERGLTER